MSEISMEGIPDGFIEMLEFHDIEWRWDYPGLLTIDLSPEYSVSTGLNGWESGTVHCYDFEEGKSYVVSDLVPETTGTAVEWLCWIKGFQMGLSRLEMPPF